MAEADTEQETQDTAGTARAGNKGLKFLRTVVIVVAVAYVMAAAFMYFTQRGFVFVPTGELATPQEKGLEGVTVETVAMADGTEVTVWRAAPKLEGAPTVLYLHGNSSNLSARWKRFKEILDSGFGLYAPSYRGYAGSGGNPSEAALISDALEHYDRAAETGTPIILHGESLGTGVATAVAAERPDADLLVLEAPYTALVDMASERYPWLPVGLLMKDPMPTRERITKVKAPVLILHGTADHVIPVDHGRRLFGFAPNPKELVILDGVDHSDLWKNGLWQKVLSVWQGRSS
ncbi:alpha/beta hydrolase [Roseibium sediminicola]|uniref:Lysophospholipase n=1 Tax=Roseibium sediminicola TaxID=2933272 RepID=A0ABT0GMQ4_9HYPH|nr:alpha/beta fold hydrolase [Roseibium sp. CAU 1639]MCK7610702.1 lysophospholipase [Roseibium sp. CAU 1639]